MTTYVFYTDPVTYSEQLNVLERYMIGAPITADRLLRFEVAADAPTSVIQQTAYKEVVVRMKRYNKNNIETLMDILLMQMEIDLDMTLVGYRGVWNDIDKYAIISHVDTKEVLRVPPDQQSEYEYIMNGTEGFYPIGNDASMCRYLQIKKGYSMVSWNSVFGVSTIAEQDVCQMLLASWKQANVFAIDRSKEDIIKQFPYHILDRMDDTLIVQGSNDFTKGMLEEEVMTIWVAPTDLQLQQFVFVQYKMNVAASQMGKVVKGFIVPDLRLIAVQCTSYDDYRQYIDLVMQQTYDELEMVDSGGTAVAVMMRGVFRVQEKQ